MSERKQHGFVGELIWDPPDELTTEEDALREMCWVSDLLGRLNVFGLLKLVYYDEDGDMHRVMPQHSVERTRNESDTNDGE